MAGERPQIDGEFGLDYQLFILNRMIEELPGDCRKHIADQLGEVVKAMAHRNTLIKTAILHKLEDVRLDVIAVEFDVEATKRERDELQQKLDELM